MLGLVNPKEGRLSKCLVHAFRKEKTLKILGYMGYQMCYEI